MITYALFSAGCEVRRERRTLDAAFRGLETVESTSRLNSRPDHAVRARLLEVEMFLWADWVEIRQMQPDRPLEAL